MTNILRGMDHSFKGSDFRLSVTWYYDKYGRDGTTVAFASLRRWTLTRHSRRIITCSILFAPERFKFHLFLPKVTLNDVSHVLNGQSELHTFSALFGAVLSPTLSACSTIQALTQCTRQCHTTKLTAVRAACVLHSRWPSRASAANTSAPIAVYTSHIDNNEKRAMHDAPCVISSVHDNSINKLLRTATQHVHKLGRSNCSSGYIILPKQKNWHCRTPCALCVQRPVLPWS